eukprot:CAMPEP_0172496260 /NCGR_PEP_ID=MMETSP1066-20121228/84196_1 /TAXON_ID=671091 /ORGANISM="Coscinodiscus wailesii, Strain CCMP2513" /LENGTH=975 /DNA_ID=CAMNT_0013268455 /DNA_START=88 /DNA_END=3015 /DNA_ORIENTATION=-
MEVTRTLHSSNPLPFTALAKILSLPLHSSSSSSSSSPNPELHITVSNPFNGISKNYYHRGYVSIARKLCDYVPESGLWALDAESDIESWIATAADVSCAVLNSDRATDPSLAARVKSFLSSVESHLFSTSRTFLAGDLASAADVVAAVLCAQACAAAGVVEAPQQTVRWMDCVLRNEVLGGLTKGLKSLKVGSVTPLEKPVVAVAAAAKGGETKAQAKKKKGKDVKKEESANEGAKTESPAPAPSSSSDTSPNTLLEKLSSLSLPHRQYSHTLCMTADELVANVPVPSSHSHTKNLFLRDKKHGLFLVSTLPNSGVNTKQLGKDLKLEGKVNLRLADEKLLMECLGCKPGTVGPLAILNDGEGKVTLVLDEGLLGVEKVHSHPLRNDMSVEMSPDDLLAYVKACGHEPVVLSFKPAESSGAGGKAPASRPPAEKKEKAAPVAGKKQKQPQQQKQANKEKNKQDKRQTKKGETLLALQWKKEENFPMWYSDVIVLSEMISYYDISGCYILRPWSYKIWELMQEWFNVKIRALGVENAYFPLFVSESRLTKEKDHVEGFSPEVAWVTKSGESELTNPIAIRPTSETIMYPAFADWIKSHRDLPLKLNQWSNVVRWEFKDPTPFLRTREFLWQEGHTAHATLEEADEMVMDALDLYRGVYEDLLGIPVIKGYKTEKEKFAGGFRTTTVEAYIPLSGRAIQGATSHNLGQNFGKMFEISFQNDKGESAIPWQTSWGLTTRTIGVMIMVHGDDTGLVLPPRVAPVQVVIVPIISKKMPVEVADPYCNAILDSLKKIGIRATYDGRTMYNPGWKFNHWEQKGVPIRLEVGPRDIEKNQVFFCIRHSMEKKDIPVSDLPTLIPEELKNIHNQMFEKVKKERDSHLVQVTEWKDFVPNLEKNNMVLTPWCGGEHQDWEEWVKEKSREESLSARGQEAEEDTCATSVAAKTLCIPFEQPELKEGTKCIASGLDATCWVLWGRSY